MKRRQLSPQPRRKQAPRRPQTADEMVDRILRDRITTPEGCWVAPEPRSLRNGIQNVWADGVHVPVARVLLERALGRPLEDGKHACRLPTCNTAGCFNPACFQEGGRAEVGRAMIMRGRGAGHGKPQLTLDQVREMRALRAQGHSYPALAERFGVWKSTAWAAVNRKTFAEVED